MEHKCKKEEIKTIEKCELNREEIIKALECCSKDDCDNCPNTFGNCYSNLAREALSLIKDLTEENERLRADLTELTHRMLDNVRTENEELCKSNECDKRKLEADTVRKMQKALEQRIHSKLSYHGWYLKETVIAETAKEMLEGGNG